MKQKLEAVLRLIARAILRKYSPKVIAITGSVGKTSTKEAIFCAIKDSFRVRQSQKNYNNEIGVPLTIIGRTSENKSIIGWLSIVWHGFTLICKRNQSYPEVLVLEVAVDRPGDMKYLRSIFTPDIVVLTSIAEVHLEAFVTIDNIANEKLRLVRDLKPTVPVFINSDNQYLAKEASANKNINYIPYGFSDMAVIKGGPERLVTDKKNRFRVLGIENPVIVEGEKNKLFLPGVISHAHVYSALAAVGVGKALGIPLETLLERLKSYHVPSGRMKLLPGIKQTLLIDDTYNASPASAKEALFSVSRIPIKKGGRRWAIFGDMLELGPEAKKMHADVGAFAYANEFDYIVTVGALAKHIALGAKKAGMNEDKVYSFDEHKVAGAFLEDRIEQGDIIVIKGSQDARMEKIVKEIMANPIRAKEVLVRQDSTWIGR